MRKKIFSLAGCGFLFLLALPALFAADIGQGLTSKEVTTLLTNKTFFVKQLRSEVTGGEKLKDFHAYFTSGGRMQINHTDSIIRTGMWGVGSRGELCFEFAVPAGTSMRIVTRPDGSKVVRPQASKNRATKACGILVKRGPYTFDRINNEGLHTATLTLVANGNKFPAK